jgi:hypothetical protein
MPLYSFVLDFDGGTYISQVAAASFTAAPAIWAKRLKSGAVKGVGGATLNELARQMTEKEPTPLTGLSHVWCTDALLRGKLALINFVETNG